MTVTERNELVEAHMRLARGCYSRFMERFPSEVEVDRDGIFSAALEALVGAASRWDPDRGGEFSVFAWTRMWGAMKDELRGVDWLPRSRRRQINHIQRAHGTAVRRLQREPSREELAEQADITVEELDEAMLDQHRGNLFLLSLPVGQAMNEQTAALVDLVREPHDGYQLLAERESFRQAWQLLDERERYVLTELVVHERAGVDVAVDLGVSESRVSQIKTAAARKLRRLHDAGPQPCRVSRAAA